MTAPVRVGLVIGQLHAGGSERQLVELARGLRRGTSCEPHVYCLSEVVNPFGPLLEKAGVALHTFRRRHSFEPRRVLALAQGLRQDRIEVVLSFSQHVNLYAYLAIRMGGGGIFLASNRATRMPESLPARWLNRIIYGGSARVVVNSRPGAAFVAEAYGVPVDRIEVIPNGIDPAGFQFHGNPTRTRAELGIAPAAPLVALVGRVSAEKRVDLFLEAARRIAGNLPECRFLVVGAGDLLEAMRSRAAEMGLGSTVLFTGVREDIPALLAAIDLLVLISDFEGLPNVIMEAMAAGRPVVAADLAGCRELVVPGVTGFLTPPGDPEALAGKVCEVLSRPDRGRALGSAGRDRIVSQFSVALMVQRFEDLFVKMARRKSPAP